MLRMESRRVQCTVYVVFKCLYAQFGINFSSTFCSLCKYLVIVNIHNSINTCIFYNIAVHGLVSYNPNTDYKLLIMMYRIYIKSIYILCDNKYR